MYLRHSYPVVVKDVILIETESDIEIFQMYGIDGAGPAPSLYQVLPCLVIDISYIGFHNSILHSLFTELPSTTL